MQWLVSLERKPPPTRRLLTIERLQGWAMLAYYPLEHLSYLASHGIIPSKIRTIPSLYSSTAKGITLDPGALGIWSCRFWAIYVALQFAHLQEDKKLLQQQQRSLRKGKGTSLSPAERQDLQQRWDSYWSELIANVGYLPLTIHWWVAQVLAAWEKLKFYFRSLKKGLFRNEVSIQSLLGVEFLIRHSRLG